MKNNFAKLFTYLRFIRRRERVISTVWIICIAGSAALIAALYPDLFPSQAELLQMAITMENPAMVAMMGPVYGMDHLTQASVMTQECLIWFLITISIMNIFLVNRHTRADEELGRLEMFRALPVGRLTGVLATTLFAALVNSLISLFTTLLLYMVNIGGTTCSGALTYGFAIGAVGFVFAGVTLLHAQIFSTSQGTIGMSFACLGLFYVLRAVGDVNDNLLSVISPFGLGLKVEAFYNNSPAPLLILFLESVFVSAIALLICAVRDHGMGVIPAKKGRSFASRFLRSPFGLAWKLSQATILGWSAGLFLLGVSYGSVCSNINEFVESNEMMQKVIGITGTNTLLDSYAAMIFIIMAMVSSVPVVLTVLKIYNEEKNGRLEQILGRSVPRLHFYGSFIWIAILESVLMQALIAIGLGVASGGELSIPSLLKASLNYLPAIWVMAALAIFLVGTFPKQISLVWLFFGYNFVVMYIGRILDLPEWVSNTTPFGNIPQMPIQEFELVPLIILTLIAVVFAIIGMLQYQRRDIR